MADDKYIVFKREDWEDLPNEIRNLYKSNLEEMERHAVPDAVVIRRQDAFASCALHTYANSMMISARTIGELAPSTRDRLQGIADYFHQQAVIADDTVSKLPD